MLTNQRKSFGMTAVAIAATVVILLVFIGAFFCWEYGDDYLNKVAMAGAEPFSYLWDLYFNHDGRHASPAGFVQMYVVKYATAPPAVLLYCILLALCGVGIYREWMADLYIRKAPGWLSGAVVFVAAIFIGLWPLFKDVLYWLTGGYYILSLCQALLLFMLARRYVTHRIPLSAMVTTITVAAVFVLCLNSQNIMLPIIVAMAAYVWWKFRNNKKVDWRFIGMFIVPAVLAMLATNLAPGNFDRLQREQPDGSMPMAKRVMAIVMMYVRFFNYSKIAVAGGLFVGLLLPSVHMKQNINAGRLWQRILVFVTLACISMAPFMLAPALARIRVYFYGVLFLMIAACYGGVLLRSIVKSNWLRCFPAAAFMIYGVIFFGNQVLMMADFKKKVVARLNYLESRRGSTVPVYYPKLELPQSLHLIRWADAEMYGDWNKTKEYFELAEYIETAPGTKPH